MITPMVARLVRDPFDRDGWFFELKWDGFRAIAETDGQGAVKLYSRNQNDSGNDFHRLPRHWQSWAVPQFLTVR